MVETLYERVYAVLARVPGGRVVTYGQLALHLGMPHGARVVGWAMQHCPEGLPWHRVLNASGAISRGGTPARIDLQRRLLEAEGVSFDAAGRVDLRQYGWDEI